MKKISVILLLVGLLAACVTINIYFPAAAAQEVADEIIDDVWQIKKDAEDKTATPIDETTVDETTVDETTTETPASN